MPVFSSAFPTPQQSFTHCHFSAPYFDSHWGRAVIPPGGREATGISLQSHPSSCAHILPGRPGRMWARVCDGYCLPS